MLLFLLHYRIVLDLVLYLMMRASYTACDIQRLSSNAYKTLFVNVNFTALYCTSWFQGENMFIESLCQTILPLEDLLWVLNNPRVDNVLKKPFLRCLHHVYMRSNGTVVETGAGELPHDE